MVCVLFVNRGGNFLGNKIIFCLCDLLLKYLNGGILYLLPNRGQTMFWTILEFCQGLNDVVQTSPPVQYNNAGLSRAPFPRKLEADHL